MKEQKKQTGLILGPVKQAFKQWAIEDLIGFKRPDGMPVDTYRRLRELKNEMYKRRAAGRWLWLSAPSGRFLSDYLKDPQSADLNIQKSRYQGTYVRALHGDLRSNQQTV